MGHITHLSNLGLYRNSIKKSKEDKFSLCHHKCLHLNHARHVQSSVRDLSQIRGQNQIFFVWTILDNLWNKSFKLFVLFYPLNIIKEEAFSVVIKSAAILNSQNRRPPTLPIYTQSNKILADVMELFGVRIYSSKYRNVFLYVYSHWIAINTI
jgi:hypothetical protein